MRSSRTTRRLGCVIILVAASLGGLHIAAAQTIVELGGGSTYRKDLPPNDSYTLGFDARLSVGRRMSDNTMLRLDAFVSEHGRKDSTAVFPHARLAWCATRYGTSVGSPMAWQA